MDDRSAFEMRVRVFDLETGAEQDRVYQREGLGMLSLSLAGETLLVTETYTTNEVTAINLITGESGTWMLDPDLRPDQRGRALGPVLVWNGEPIIVRGSEHIVEKQLGPLEDVPAATPAASPGASAKP